MHRHIAHQMPFDELMRGLEEACAQRLVYARPGPDGLQLFTYSERCVYDGAWTPVTMAARGLVVDRKEGRIAATPFPKFFNFGERGEPVPDLPFEAMEKLDGSLIILFHHADRWTTATRGAFDSAQAKWAGTLLEGYDQSHLRPGVTYLAEAIYPENRIVLRYDEAAMVLLAAYDDDGIELPSEEVDRTSAALGWRALRRYTFDSISDMVVHAETLPRTEEGFVVRFENGHRLKIKGNEYRRIHALISRVTPLALWEAMAAGDDLEALRRDLPEEFWEDFDSIRRILDTGIAELMAKIEQAAKDVAQLSDKEVGLRLMSLDSDVRRFIFTYRKDQDALQTGRHRAALLRAVRPTGNELPGYVASYAIRKVIEESR